MKFCTR